MKKCLLIILPVITTCISCNNMIKNAFEQVENSVKTSKIAMDSNIVSAKEAFLKTYKIALHRTSDTLGSNKIARFYFKINSTTNYIDSLKYELNKMDGYDLKSTELIKQLFINQGIGDSVFNKVKSSYGCAIDIANSDTTKLRLKKVQNTYTNETKKTFFEMNQPFGVIMILYGIELELLKDGAGSLNGYREN